MPSIRLVDLIRHETGADFPQIMLMRHFNTIDTLLAFGGTVEEFTSLQPIGSKWDFWQDGKPRIDVVAVIVHDRVHGVFRVVGVEAEATGDLLVSDAHRRFDLELNRLKLELLHRRFNMVAIPSTSVNARVTGWEGREINPVLRSSGELFWNINVDLTDRFPINVEDRDRTDAELEAVLREVGLQFPNIVATSSAEAVARQRRGQDAIRRLTLQNYETRCAICDVSDACLLRASHIVGWAEREESRGDLSNVICLCAFHDVLFENGYWSLDNHLNMVVRSGVFSSTIQSLLPAGGRFRNPSAYPPGLEFVRYHRTKHRLATSS